MATIPIYFDKDKYEEENGKPITICLKTYEEPAVLSRYKDPTIEELQDRIDKTIKYLERLWYYEDLGAYQLEEVKQMLKGEDNKYEIPQFEGTLEQLDKLSIRGEEDER